MTPEEKLITVAENTPKVYKSGQDVLWRGILNDRGNFSQQFKDWQLEYIRPPFKITPVTVGSANQMLRGNTLLRAVESNYFDFSQLQTGSSNQEGLYYTFYGCNALEVIEDVGIGENNSIYGFNYTFSGCSKLHTIEKLKVAEATRYSNVFNSCNDLTNVTFDGVIGQNGLNLQWSPLSHNSIMSIINALADKTGNTSTKWTVTLGEANISKLSTEEQKIAKDKGWTLA